MDKEQDKYIEECARVVVKILKQEGAVRLADNITPRGVPVEALLIDMDELGFPISPQVYYNDVRPKCIELGYDVTAAGTGQYIGKRGEAVARNVQNARNQITGRVHNQRKILTAASDSMSLKDGNEYSMIHFGMDLGTAAELFRLVGEYIGDYLLPWPKELSEYLLSAELDNVPQIPLVDTVLLMKFIIRLFLLFGNQGVF